MALSAEETKSLLDSLFALPDKEVKKAKPKAAPATRKPAPVGAPSGSRVTVASVTRGFIPALKIKEIVVQECETCGTRHEYLRNRLVRFDGPKNAALELPTCVVEALPISISEVWEKTSECPTCLRLGLQVEVSLDVASPSYVQMDLFS